MGAAITSMVGANLPDADLLYSGTGSDPLAYMLHHREYNHTALVALIGAAALWAVALVVHGRTSPGSLSGGGTSWLLATVVISALSHLLLDWIKTYGIHPFWPIDARWIHGDSFFIVEPWFSVVTIPTLVAADTSRLARRLPLFALRAGLALAWRVSLVCVGAASALTAGAILTALAVRAMTPPACALTSLGAWITVTAVMATGTAVARAAAARGVRAHATGAELLDVLVTPLPANPLYNMVSTVERTDDRYVVQVARVSAALRFLRVPVWLLVGTSAVPLGDARFGGTAPGIVTLIAPRLQTSCALSEPPRTPPRSDLLPPRNVYSGRDP